VFIITFFTWIALSIGIYSFAPRSHATWIVLIGGWILLPPAIYLTAGDRLIFPFWIIGSALPSDLLVTKAWAAPTIAIVGSLIFDRKRWSKIQFHWTDVAIMAFCLWPLVQSLALKQPDPSSIMSSLYLIGSWALPWLIGRLYLRDRNDALVFAAVIALWTLAMFPLMVIEGVSTFRIYAVIFGPHPFAFDGLERYIGYRPQLFFEHGNQYGIWCAGATIAAFWRFTEARRDERRSWIAIFYILLAVTIVSQSAGAILLMLFGLAMLSIPSSFKLLHSFGAIAFAAILLLGTLHLSGIVPLRSIGEKTVVGKTVVDGFRGMGRGSFVWRLGQDLKALPLIQENPVIGSGRWNWFMTVDSRPWGLPLLILGQFGLIGLTFLAAALLGAVYRHLADSVRASAPAPSRLFTVLLLIFGIDALLNSFVFYPAILVAAAFFRVKTGDQTALPIDRQTNSSA
jgi:hypothetical protein